MKYRELLVRGRTYLAEQGILEADTDAWLLFEYVTGIDRTHYFLRQEEECGCGQCSAYEEIIEKRAKHIPLQYLTGWQEFMGYPFQVNSHVLIPRQDTELLVMETLKRIGKDSRILDMCTGSGCIAVSLCKKIKTLRAEAADISEEALKVAEENAVRLGADVKFICSDLFQKVEGTYDCIVSNPPYIRSSEIGKLMPEVGKYEPVLALDGREDGLYFYRRIVKEAGVHLKSGGWLLLEIGFDQGKAVSELMEKQGYQETEIKKDLAGLDRVAAGRWR